MGVGVSHGSAIEKSERTELHLISSDCDMTTVVTQNEDIDFKMYPEGIGNYSYDKTYCNTFSKKLETSIILLKDPGRNILKGNTIILNPSQYTLIRTHKRHYYDPLVLGSDHSEQYLRNMLRAMIKNC